MVGVDVGDVGDVGDLGYLEDSRDSGGGYCLLGMRCSPIALRVH